MEKGDAYGPLSRSLSRDPRPVRADLWEEIDKLNDKPFTNKEHSRNYYWEEEHKSTDEEMRYDMLVRMRDWDGIEQLSREEPPQSLAATNAVRLAQYYNKRLDGQMLYQELTTSNKVLRSEASAFLMSEIYLHTGMVNMSQRAVFEAMDTLKDVAGISL